MSRGVGDQTVGPWAREKLASLEAYLNYYTTRLKNQAWLRATYYVDAFAGPGDSPIRGTGPLPTPVDGPFQANLFDVPEDPARASTQYLKGSPRVALELVDPFSHYVFVERDPDRLAALRGLQQEFDGRHRIEVVQGDANQAMLGFLSRGINFRSTKGVVFLDPFGMNLPWSTIEAISRTKGLEVIVNFPFDMAINRLLTNTGTIDEAWRARLDQTFGCGDWFDLAYDRREGIFGPDLVKRQDTRGRVLDWYAGRLREAFGHVATPQEVRNTRGNPIYHLFWAGPHEAGLKGAEHILGRRPIKKR